MKQGKGFLFALLPFAAISLAGCPLQQASSQKPQVEPATIKFQRAEGVNFTFTPAAPIEKKDGEEDVYMVSAALTLASFDHTTGVILGHDQSRVEDSNVFSEDPDVYFFLKGAIEIPENQDVYFDAGASTGSIFQDSAIVKCLRIAFYSEEASFVYAPFQEADKCMYSAESTVKSYGDELFDKNSTGKVLLPSKHTTLVMWLDGNDENAINENADKPFTFSLTLAFA
ncbi:MAG: hypothetical protein J6038_00420 [Bacilli bacterium]|nr:hypothetical protein [Bacilli bacterium]